MEWRPLICLRAWIFLPIIICSYYSSHVMASMLPAVLPADPSSFARPDVAVVTNIDLNWLVDFDRKTLSGTAELSLDVLKDTDEIILDACDLNISSIKSEDGRELQYEVTDDTPNFGSKLTVRLPTLATAATKLKLIAAYSTSPKAHALQWLEASQTLGKLHPYLFSQCQPIHARSIVPCQDTPAVKFTYTARVRAPPQLVVLMSALREVGEGETKFRQPVPIPSYLLAIAVGDLQSKTLGPRSTVWTEGGELERSAWEFAETEQFLRAAERLCGDYVWGEYNLLVLPPSFPYGGMENPCLTFVTPTLLAGDRSQADVIIHEIMHSWSGNLATNKNFQHFWLNEGFTVFLERKVAASLIADEETSRLSRDFESLLGLQELTESIKGHLGAANALTSLVVNLEGVHPDDAFSRVPYEKGSLFLRYIEDLVGGPSVFDDFLKAYFEHFKYRSLDTEQFKSFLLDYFESRNNMALDAVDWQTWLHAPGMPPVIPEYNTTMAKRCRELVARIYSEPASALTAEDITDFSPHQIIHVLQELLERDPLPIDKLRAIGSSYKFASSHNCEVVFRWQRLSIRSRDETIVDKVLDFVNSQGRMKYVRPLYRDLYAWEETRLRAINNFLKQESTMMHVVSYVLKKDLHLQ